MYAVTAILHVKPEHVEDMKKLLVQASQTYLKDEGTEEWHVHQSTKDPQQFLIYELYRSEADLETHRANPFYKTFGESVTPWVDARTEISRWEGLD
ncbi:MAG TPA: putative quinol monooxygenase [Dehalococcoidia bacterium]|nr:putative quinol monooxygenase [Dehalococcoidia bacterium]